MTTSILNKDQKYTFDNTRQNPNVQGSPLFHAINITQSSNERNSLSAAGFGGFFQPPRMCAWDLLYVSDLLVIGCNVLSTHRITKSCNPTIKFARFAQGFKMIIHSDSVTLSVCLSLVFLSPPQYVWSSGQFAENILHKAVYTWKQKKSSRPIQAFKGNLSKLLRPFSLFSLWHAVVQAIHKRSEAPFGTPGGLGGLLIWIFSTHMGITSHLCMSAYSTPANQTLLWIYQESLQSPIELGWLWTALGVQSAQSAVHPHPGGMVLGPCQQFVWPLLCDTGLYQTVGHSHLACLCMLECHVEKLVCYL